VTYPICVVEHSTGQIQNTQHLSTHQMRFYVLDLINRANETNTNEQDVLSDAFSIAEDLIALIRDPAYNDTWFCVGDGSVTMITDYTQDSVGGVAFDLPISSVKSSRLRFLIFLTDLNFLSNISAVAVPMPFIFSNSFSIAALLLFWR
jgi:hypothetical protein